MQKRYEQIGWLGRGGVSEVIRAYDHVRGREVAIKKLLPLDETHLNEAHGKELQRETDALTRLQHPNVVRLLEVDQDQNGAFLVLELIDGETLSDVIKEAALTYGDFLEVARQALSAMRVAQDFELVHRDLKPGNLMLRVDEGGNMELKILDFGLSKFQSQPRQQTVDLTGSILGSVDYISPEQLDLLPIDSRADLYSLGCVFYYCLAQEPPFHGESPAQTVQHHLDHVVRALHLQRRDVPRAVCDWVMQLISRDPEDRPQNADEAFALLEKASGEALPGRALDDEGVVLAPYDLEETLMPSFSKHGRRG